MTKFEIRKIVNRYIGVFDGYLSNFSYRTHADFYPDYCDLEIDPNEYEGTTRERFISILQSSSPNVQAKIIRGVLQRFPLNAEEKNPSTRTQELYDDLLKIAERLESGLSKDPEPNLTSTESLSTTVNSNSGVRIFLAHASEDKYAVIELYERLKQQGYRPWLDKKDLLAGQSWRAEIPKAIENSDVFIACLSQTSVGKQGYVQREFKMALNKCADKPPGTIFLIPLRLDDCKIPELRQEEYGVNLRDYQWLDYWEPDGFEKLVRAIEWQFNSQS